MTEVGLPTTTAPNAEKAVAQEVPRPAAARGTPTATGIVIAGHILPGVAEGAEEEEVGIWTGGIEVLVRRPPGVSLIPKMLMVMCSTHTRPSRRAIAAARRFGTTGCEGGTRR